MAKLAMILKKSNPNRDNDLLAPFSGALEQPQMTNQIENDASGNERGSTCDFINACGALPLAVG
ncbi:hypothetical protein ACSS6W_009041 [Trichoderma asperelloides]